MAIFVVNKTAGLLIAEAAVSNWWEGISFDLRVDDHPKPLEELARLLNLRKAYLIAEIGDNAAAAGDQESAEKAYMQAGALAPESTEILFWHAVILANLGKTQAAQQLLRTANGIHDSWRELFRRLPAAGFLTIDETTLANLLPDDAAGSDSKI